MSVETRLQELCELIPSYAQSYYDGKAEISDEEFDALVDELREIDPENKILTSVGWGAKTKTTWGHLTERSHTFTVTGLSKVKSSDLADMNSHLTGKLISSKLDGISAVVYYENGNFLYVLTRGDGRTGLDITSNLTHLIGTDIPKTLEDKSVSWVRGELVIRKEVAEKSNYSNARNMVAGLANSKEVSEYHKEIHFRAYDYSGGVSSSKFDELRALGFKTPRYSNLDSVDYESVKTKFDYTKFEDAKNYPFLTDGIVVNSYGASQDHYAIKYPNEVKEVKVLGVEINCSELGNLIPVILIEPTYIDGVTISRTSGFNFESIKQAQIGPGAIIKLKRANEVIPHWEGTVKSGEYFEPTKWEGKPTYWKGVHLKVDLDKTESTIRTLISYKTPKGFAGAKINDLITAYNLTSFEELKKLPEKVNAKPLKEVFSPAFVYMAMETVLGIIDGWTISEILLSAKIDGVGDVACSMLEEYYLGEEDQFVSDVANSMFPNLDYPTYLVMEGLNKNAKYLAKIVSNVRIKKGKVKEETPLDAIPVCVTGKLSVSRGEFFKRNAGKVVEVDIKKAKYLITDNPNSGSSKNKTAQKLGIEILSEEQFYEKFGV